MEVSIHHEMVDNFEEGFTLSEPAEFLPLDDIIEQQAIQRLPTPTMEQDYLYRNNFLEESTTNSPSLQIDGAENFSIPYEYLNYEGNFSKYFKNFFFFF